MRTILFILCFTQAIMIFAQDPLYSDYDKYKETTITAHRFGLEKIQPLIESWANTDFYNVKKIGESLENRPVYILSAGSGPVDVLLWSQMHGDESTATMALFDIFQYLYQMRENPQVRELLSQVTIHVVPMLNPDGAHRFRRRNAQQIDINRDALRLQTPEGQLLKHVRDSLQPDFGFNLHDQSRYYNVEGTPATATLSFLAPAYDYEKSINSVRKKAMQVIVSMNEEIQKYAPGRVGRYSDEFEPRAFGDNIQKWGTSTILIESGGYPDDPDKQYIRKLNYVAILTALYAISDASFEDINPEDYEQIPRNDRKLLALKIESASHTVNNTSYVIDIGFTHSLAGDSTESGFFYKAGLEDLGDLSTYFGNTHLDARGMKIVPAKMYPETLKNMDQVRMLDPQSTLQNGYGYIRVQDLAIGGPSPFPYNLVGLDYQPEHELTPGGNPSFFLEKDGELLYAVINGFLINLKEEPLAGQGLIFIK